MTPAGVRLLLTALEDRLTPATPTTLHWLGAVSGQWGTAGNWAENTTPASGDTLVFDTTATGFAATTAAFAPTNDVSGLTGLTLVINDASAAGDFTISGTAFGLTATAGVGIASTVSVGTAATVSTGLTLGADTTVDVGLGALTLGGAVGDAGGAFALTETGSPAGTLTLGGANTYGGGTVLAAGNLAVGTNTSLGSGLLTFTGGTLTDAGAFLHLANPFVVAAPSTIGGGGFFNLDGDGILNADLFLANTGFLALDGALSGPAGLKEIGFPGTTTLGGTAANTFTGGATVLFGALVLQKTAGVNALASPVTLTGSATSLALSADDQLNGNVPIYLGLGSSFSSNGHTDSVLSLTGLGGVNTGTKAAAGLTVTGGGAQLLTGSVQGAGFLTYNGPGSLTLAGASGSYTGTLTAAGGELVVAADFSGAPARVTGGTLGGTGVVKTVTATGGTVEPSGAGTGGTLTTASASSGTLASSLNGATFQADLAPRIPAGQLALGANATLDLTGAALSLNPLGATLAGAYPIITSPTGGISGTFDALPDGATLAVGGQTFRVNYTTTAVTLTDVAAPVPTTLHWTGAVNGQWGTAGNWAENTTPVSGDTLVFDTSTPGFAATATAFAPTNNLGTLSNLTVVINDASTAGDFAIGGTRFGLATAGGVGIASTVSAGAGATVNTGLTLAADTTIDVGLGTLTLAGSVGGPGALIKDGAPGGTLALSLGNTYAGGTVLTAGILSVGANTSLGAGPLTFNGGTLANAVAHLTLTNPYVVTAPSTIGGGSFFDLSGDGTLDADLRLTNTGFLTLDGALSGPAGLIEDGFPGSTILSGPTANTFTGPTTIISGDITLQKTAGVNALVSPVSVGSVGGSGSFPTLGWGSDLQLNGHVSVTVGAGGTLNTSGHTDSVAGLSGIGTLNTGSTIGAGLTVTGGGALLLTGPVQGSGFLTYNGPGSLTLGGASSSYGGTLTAAGGTLVVAADFSGAVARATTGGTLAGTGAVRSFTIAGGGGSISPGGGGAGGILTTAPGGTLASRLSGQTLRVDLSDVAPTDQLVVGNAATLDLTGAALQVNALHTGFGDVFTIVSSATGGISGTFTGRPDASTLTVGGHLYRIHYTPNAVTLTDLQAVSLSPSTPALPTGEVGIAYGQSITSTGGTGAVTLSVSVVANPTGLTIDGDGTGTITVSGTPTGAGTVTFTVTPSDDNGAEAGTTYSFTVNPGVVLSPTTLPAGDVGLGYSRSITLTGGTGAVTLAVSGVTNPTGLTIGGDGTGTITVSGTPTGAGTLSFIVTPSDAIGTGTGTVYSVTVNPAVTLSPALPDGEVGLGYSQSITPTGGTAPVRLSVSGVTNPTGLTIGGDGTGAITVSGTPTGAGTLTFTVTPSDAAGTGTGTMYSVTVGPGVVLDPVTLPAGEVGLGYSGSITSTGGTGAVTLAVSGVTNPTGLIIGGDGTGTITVSGTPTGAGTLTFTVTPSDAIGTGTGTVYSVTVNPTATPTPLTLPPGDIGLNYHGTITSTGGTGAVTLAVSGVTNPTGLTIDGDGTGTITVSGTPTAAGTVTFTVTPSDAAGTGTGTVYSFDVGPAVVLDPATTTLPTGEVGLGYSQSIGSTGGSGGVTLSVSGVTNPTGLTIGGTGTGTITVSGTPTGAGTVTFTVTPSDDAGTGTGTVYSFTVAPGVALSPVTLPAGDVGLGYSQSIGSTGGSGAVTLAVSGVTNPTGLTIGGDGTGTITVSGTPTGAGTVTFTVTPSDAIGTGTGTVYAVTVGPTVTLNPVSIPAGEVGLAYAHTITSTGGSGGVTLSVSGVTNPTGLTIGGTGTGTIAVSGTPTGAGTVTFTVTPSDDAGTGAGTVYSFTVAPGVVLSPTTFPAGDVGLGYSQSIGSTGGSGAVTLAVSGVTNPTGLTIGGDGTGTITVSGTPTAAGTVTFTVTPSDAIGTGAGTVYSFTVAPGVALSPATLPAGEVGLAYTHAITSTGGSGGVTLAVSGVTNPTGLTIGGTGTGTITVSGTPTAAGTVTFTVTPSDAAGTEAGTVYSFTVAPAVVLGLAALPAGEIGLGYSQSIGSTGGSGAVTLAVSGVVNPTGLTIGGTGTGTITVSGTPTGAGTVTFTVTPSDAAGTGAGKVYSFTVYPAVGLSTAVLPPGDVGTGYSRTITTTGGSAPVALAVSGVTNPTGLTIGGSGTGTITVSGTPTAAGTVTFTVTPSDAVGTGAGKVYSFTVAPAVALSPATFPNGEVGTGYSHTITSTGGSAPVTLSVSGVINPTGLTIGGTGTGTITVSGTPTAAGTVTFTVTPSDIAGTAAGTVYSFTVAPAAVLPPAALPAGEVGFGYNRSITSTGGTGAVTLSVSGVTNPTGLTIGGDGTGTITVSGTPTAAGTVTFTVTPSDAIGTGTGVVYGFTVHPTMALSPSSLPDGGVGTSYSRSIGSTGGTGAVTLSVSGVTNPTGLTIGGTGTGTITVSGTPTAAGTVTFTVTPADAAGTGTAAVYSFTVTAPAANVVGPPQFAVGSDTGGPATVTVYNADGSVANTLTPFPGTTGGVRTSTADFTGDGTPDVAAGVGPGATAEVKILDGKTGAVLFDVKPFADFTGGVFVSTGDVDGDGKPDLIVTPDLSGGPRVEVFSGGDFHQIANFFGIDDPNFRGGARAAVGDINGDGVADLVISAGFGGGPRISVYDGKALAQGQEVHLVPDFFLFEPGLRNGAYVAVGDVDGDGFADIIGGGGPGGGPRVLVISGKTLLSSGAVAALGAPVANFFAGDTSNRGGIRVTAKNLDGDKYADVVVGAGTGAGSAITAYLGKNLAAGDDTEDLSFDAFSAFSGGVYVG